MKLLPPFILFSMVLWLLYLPLNANSVTTIHIGHDSQINAPSHLAMLAFKEQVERESRGSLKVKIFPARQFGDVYETCMLVQQGNLQMTFGATMLLTNIFPEYYTLDSLYLFNSFEQAKASLLNKELRDILLKPLETKGFKGFGFMASGFRVLTNSQKPIYDLSDLAALKIRVASSPMQIQTWKSLGALPISLSFGEVFLSLQQGLINAQESSLFSIFHERFFEGQSHLSLTYHSFTNYIVFMQKAFFEKLSKEEQAIVVTAAESAIEQQWSHAQKENQRALELLSSTRITINTPNNSFKESVKTLMQGSIEKQLRHRAGGLFYDHVIEEINRIKQKS
ncbi:MAG: TRAP transporter substrate-binding protein [Cellvibrionales bacterium]|nr:TRAP transporter substrate-binding protein [Cellvibrionales bacterium]